MSHQELEEFLDGLNESPRPKAGKCDPLGLASDRVHASMKVPALRRGNTEGRRVCEVSVTASMKVPALRRGNDILQLTQVPIVGPQ